MTRTFLELSQLTNRALLQRVDELVRRERRLQAALIANLSELDARKLYLDEGCRSFYVYCIEKLGYSESAAYRRMEAARAARRFPVILDRLTEGTLNLTTVALLAKHLTAANYRELLAAAAGRSRRDVEALIAQVCGGVPPQRSTVRVVLVAAPRCASVKVANGARDTAKSTSAGGSELSGAAAGAAAGADAVSAAGAVSAADAESAGAESPAAGAASAAVLAYRHSITLTAEEQADLERARELLRTLIPNGDPARVVGKALRQLVATLEARKFGAVKKSRAARTTPRRDTRTADAPEPRTIPAAVRREVTARDAGQCTFVASNGHRCTERGALEFHHRTPLAKAGRTTPANLTLLCAWHHRQESERTFGPTRVFAAARTTSVGGSRGTGPPT